VPYQQSFHPGWGGPKRSTPDRISRHTQDRWAPRQIGQDHLANPVGPPPTGGQTALPRREQFSPKKVYKPKIIEEEVQEMDIDSERTTALTLFRLGQWTFPLREVAKDRLCQTIRLLHQLKRDMLLMIMRPAEVSLVQSAFCQGGALPVNSYSKEEAPAIEAT
jgi:hypothetical protein